ncbi:MAG: hypothetical protein P8X74_16455 [Reinekea sp.]
MACALRRYGVTDSGRSQKKSPDPRIRAFWSNKNQKLKIKRL